MQNGVELMALFKKITACILASVMLTGILCSCSVSGKDNPDAKRIKEIAEEFLDAAMNENTSKMRYLCKGYDPDTYSLWRDASDECYEIYIKVLQTAEIDDFGTPHINKVLKSAEITATVSQLDLKAFYEDNSSYIKYEDTLKALDRYSGYTETDIDLEFTYDDARSEWFLTSNSAERLRKLISSLDIFSPVKVTTSEAEELVNSYLENIASGVFHEEFDWNDCQVYDNTVDSGTSTDAQEATKKFISAYIRYVLDHDHTIETERDYKYVLKGYAPSHDELSRVLFTDEFQTRAQMNRIRYEESLLSVSGLWDRQTVLVYEMLADAVANCSPEDYKITITVDAYSEECLDQLPTCDSLIIRPTIGFYQADHGPGWEQLHRCLEEALKRLYESGEITNVSYKARLERLTPDNYGYVPDDYVSLSGHPNQALGTHEQFPSNISDDENLMYGYSNTDQNGFWMHYSKDYMEILKVGYCVDDSGIWIMSRFLEPFDAGTNLLVEWKIDGNTAGSSRITIGSDFENEIEVHLETDGFPSSPHVYEMYLWSEGRDHQYIYAALTDTD